MDTYPRKKLKGAMKYLDPKVFHTMQRYAEIALKEAKDDERSLRASYDNGDRAAEEQWLDQQDLVYALGSMVKSLENLESRGRSVVTLNKDLSKY